MNALIITILFILSFNLYDSPTDIEICNLQSCELTDPPIYPGGVAAMHRLFNDSANYPECAVAAAIQGTVSVQYIIGKQGNIEEVSVIKGVCTEIDEEAVRLILLMKPWQPARLHGKNISYRQVQTFTFSIPDEMIENSSSSNHVDSCTTIGFL
jgi:TonB family protein